MLSCAVQGGTVVNHDQQFKADVLIEGEHIKEVASNIKVALTRFRQRVGPLLLLLLAHALLVVLAALSQSSECSSKPLQMSAVCKHCTTTSSITTMLRHIVWHLALFPAGAEGCQGH